MFQKLRTWAEFLAATPQEQDQWMREYLAACERAYRREIQDDTEADQRAFARGHGDLDPGPGQHFLGTQSSTSRTEKP